jgi:hypothetical protein
MPRNVDPELIKLLTSMGLAANNSKPALTPKPKRNNKLNVPGSLVRTVARGKSHLRNNKRFILNALARNSTGMSTAASRATRNLASATKGKKLTTKQKQIVRNYHGRTSARAYRG